MEIYQLSSLSTSFFTVLVNITELTQQSPPLVTGLVIKLSQFKNGVPLLDGITDSKDMILSKLWGRVRDREACCDAVHGIAKSHIWLSDWTMHSCQLNCAVLSHFSHVRLFSQPANQAPLSMGFSRQEYWSGLPCPPCQLNYWASTYPL